MPSIEVRCLPRLVSPHPGGDGSSCCQCDYCQLPVCDHCGAIATREVRKLTSKGWVYDWLCDDHVGQPVLTLTLRAVR